MPMCTANATLVYGLTVRASSLVFAADAWTRIEPTLPFFDLVFLRRRYGGLVSITPTGDGPVTRVPNEIWEEIRYWLVQEEIATSEESLLRPRICNNGPCVSKVTEGGRVKWRKMKKRKSCSITRGGVEDWLEHCEERWRSTTIPKAKALLSHFGLALSSENLITEHSTDDSALVLIAAPSHFQNGSSSSPYATAGCDLEAELDHHSLVDVSLRLAPDMKKRFTNLIRLFALEVVTSSVNKLVTGKVEDTLEASGKAKTSGFENKTAKSINPRWRLYVACKSD